MESDNILIFQMYCVCVCVCFDVSCIIKCKSKLQNVFARKCYADQFLERESLPIFSSLMRGCK